MKYAIRSRGHGVRPDARPLTGNMKTDSGEVEIESAELFDPEEHVWDEQEKRLRKRQGSEVLNADRARKIEELEAAYDAYALAEFGGRVAMLISQAFLNRNDARIQRILTRYSEVEAKREQAAKASSEQLKTITF